MVLASLWRFNTSSTVSDVVVYAPSSLWSSSLSFCRYHCLQANARLCPALSTGMMAYFSCSSFSASLVLLSSSWSPCGCDPSMLAQQFSRIFSFHCCRAQAVVGLSSTAFRYNSMYWSSPSWMAVFMPLGSLSSRYFAPFWHHSLRLLSLMKLGSRAT